MAGMIDFYKQHRWANDLVIAACEQLSDDVLDAPATITYGSIRDTLVHLISTQEAFLMTMNNQPGIPDPLRFSVLRARSRASDEELIRIVESRDPNEVLRGEFGGRKYKMELIVPLMQCINHGTEHRAQVCSLLGAHGTTPPRIDVWGFIDVFTDA